MEALAAAGREPELSKLAGGREGLRAPPPPSLPLTAQRGSSSCSKASCPSLRQVLAEFSLPPSSESSSPLPSPQAGAESAAATSLLGSGGHTAQPLPPWERS